MNSSKFISSTTSTTSTTGMVFTSIFCVADTQFETLTADDGYTLTKSEGTLKMADATSPITFYAGSYIYGRYSTLKLKTGAVIAYEGF